MFFAWWKWGVTTSLDLYKLSLNVHSNNLSALLESKAETPSSIKFEPSRRFSWLREIIKSKNVCKLYWAWSFWFVSDSITPLMLLRGRLRKYRHWSVKTKSLFFNRMAKAFSSNGNTYSRAWLRFQLEPIPKTYQVAFLVLLNSLYLAEQSCRGLPMKKWDTLWRIALLFACTFLCKRFL